MPTFSSLLVLSHVLGHIRPFIPEGFVGEPPTQNSRLFQLVLLVENRFRFSMVNTKPFLVEGRHDTLKNARVFGAFGEI